MAAIEEENLQLNKSALREFAVNARRKLKERVEFQANLMGFYEDGHKVQYEFEDENEYRINEVSFSKKQANILKRQIKEKGYAQVIDEVAYTWFNRFVALYYMEVNGYSENNCNIISNLSNLSQYAISINSFLNDKEKRTIVESVNNNKEEPILKTLLIHQCNVMNKKLPFLFESIEDYTELLFPSGLLTTDSVLNDMLSLDKSNWQIVEVIGWLYQYYIAEKKDEVFADLKKGKKISKENIPAATQIFTPKWIVKYMVENSVGKLWLESHPNKDLEKEFKYYLESAQQDDEVKIELEKIINKNIKPENIKVLDPACGSGHILVTAFEVLFRIYKAAGYIENEIPSLILKNNLYGLDICNRAAQLAQLAVVMKAYEYDKEISNKITDLNICSIQDSNWFDSRVKECLMNGVNNQLLAKNQIDLMESTFKDAKEYGSIIDVKDFDFEFWDEKLYAIQTLNMGLLYIDVVEMLNEKLPQLVKQAKIMQQKYECVIANPPYMGGKGMAPKLSEFVKKHYPLSRSDMFAIFKEVILNKTKKNCYSATINQHSWMFLSSYEDLRKHILNNTFIDTMVHLGTRAFEEIAGEVVQTTTYVTRKFKLDNYMGKFVRLTDFSNAQLKEEEFLKFDKNNIFMCKQNGFNSIPGSPIAYWANLELLKDFKLSIKDRVSCCTGLVCGSNEKYIRCWHEVLFCRIKYNSSSWDDTIRSFWFPYNHGGRNIKWYGNHNEIVYLNNKAYLISREKNSMLRNKDTYFKSGITWNRIGSPLKFSARITLSGFVYDDVSPMGFTKNILLYLGYFNSCVFNEYLKIFRQGFKVEKGQIEKVPCIIVSEQYKIIINKLVEQNIQISKDDWDSFETSWDFEEHPLIRFKTNNKIQDSFNKWKEYKEEQFNKLKSNEEELNRIFIEIYGLQDEMTPEVAEKDITIAKADELREIKSLMSYAVGCMFGRYSLDEKGLAYAGGDFDKTKYQTLEVDEDGILPILDGTWFEDDIVEEFKLFIKKAFGELYFNENMQYIADVLGRKSSESAKDRIRTYYLKEFYKDHLQIYKKRPIYWMFTSGKEKAFNSLIYLHRYDKTTLSRLRKDYLHEYQAKLDRAKAQAEDEGNVKLNSLYSKYQSEILEYDRKLQVLADSQIELDLDDGVKVNYSKFPGLLEAEKEVIGKSK